jgi:hypothetical protein
LKAQKQRKIMEFASLETAKKLKEAGFPQPEPALWQVWYGLLAGQQKPVVLLTKERIDDTTRFSDQYKNYHGSDEFNNRLSIYAPTATEIITVLECMESEKMGWLLSPSIKGDNIEWACFQCEVSTGKIGLGFSGETAIEAAAAAYIHQNTKADEGK